MAQATIAQATTPQLATAKTATVDSGELLGLLGEQRAQYLRLRAMADRQRVLIEADDAQGLLSVLGERQRVVDELSRINAALTPYRERWVQVYRGLGGETQRQVRSLLEECNALLSAIVASDQQDAETLGARRQIAATAISAASLAGRAAAAYAAREVVGVIEPRTTEACA